MSKWYEDSACNEGIVISSRVRLARNLKKYPFPETMNETQTKQMIDEVKDAIVNERTPIHTQVDCCSCPGIKLCS